MEVAVRARLNVVMDVWTKIVWWLGWNPTPTYILLVSMALLGWVLFRHPVGLFLGLLAGVPRWKAISLINKTGQGYLDQAKSHVKEQGARRLGVHLDTAICNVSSTGLGNRPWGASWHPSSIFQWSILQPIFRGLPRAIFRLHDFTVHCPSKVMKIYYRHVSAVNYHPPHVEVTLSDGKTIKRFSVGSDGGSAVVSALRAKLRALVPSAMTVPKPGALRSGSLQRSLIMRTNASGGPDGELHSPITRMRNDIVIFASVNFGNS